jgi:hypothetical protein
MPKQLTDCSNDILTSKVFKSVGLGWGPCNFDLLGVMSLKPRFKMKQIKTLKNS